MHWCGTYVFLCEYKVYIYGEGNGNPLQYSCLENPMDRVWWATVHGVISNWTLLSNQAHRILGFLLVIIHPVYLTSMQSTS